MERHGVDQHVIVPLPWIESVPEVHADPGKAEEAAHILNDELAEMVSKYPHKFIPVAILPTTNQDVMLLEYERAIRTLKFKGVYLVCGPTVRPLDDPCYHDLFVQALRDDIPIWLHPSRPLTYSDYVGETASKYGIWQSLGWLMDSSTAMIRLTLSGTFDRYRGLKFVIHHHGAFIGLFAKRLNAGFTLFRHIEGFRSESPITEPFIDHFKNFSSTQLPKALSRYSFKTLICSLVVGTSYLEQMFPSTSEGATISPRNRSPRLRQPYYPRLIGKDLLPQY